MLTIRASMLPSYCDCPRRAAARLIPIDIEDAGYTLREPGQGIGAIFGTAFHAGASAVIAGKLMGATVNLASSIELSISKLRERAGENATTYDATTPTLNAAETQLQTLGRCFYHDVAPAIVPIIPPETKRVARLSDEVGISGTIDVESVNSEISDYKTGHLRNHFGQMGIYSLLRKTEQIATGVPAAEARGASGLKIIHFPRVKVGKPYPGPEIVSYPVPIAERLAWATVGYIRRDVLVFRHTKDPDAFACNPMSMICSPKYCPCHGTDFCEVTL